MNHILRTISASLVAVLLIGTIHVRAADAPAAIAVKTVRPMHGEIHRFVTLPGDIKPNQQATLYAKVPGYLKSLNVDKGDRVSVGQALGEIEVPELLADRTRYQAEVRVAEADFKRVSAAQTKAPDLVTPQSVDEARGRLEMARANLERTETLLGYSRLTAPFAGVVTARFVDPGAFIPSATSGSAADNAAVVTLMDSSTVRAQVSVPEIEAARVRVGQPVKVTLDSLGGKTFAGNVSRMALALDNATKSMLVEADLPNSHGEMLPGMYATVRVGVEKHENALLVPVAALVMEKGNAFVFVADGGKARRTAVKIGFNDGVNVEISSGLNSSEPVILVGKLTLADGQAINMTEGQ